jgi:hypothetical protein
MILVGPVCSPGATLHASEFLSVPRIRGIPWRRSSSRWHSPPEPRGPCQPVKSRKMVSEVSNSADWNTFHPRRLHTRHSPSYVPSSCSAGSLSAASPAPCCSPGLGQYYVNSSFRPRGYLRHLGSIFRLEHRVAMRFQKLTHQLAHPRLILHRQNGCASARLSYCQRPCLESAGTLT